MRSLFRVTSLELKHAVTRRPDPPLKLKCAVAPWRDTNETEITENAPAPWHDTAETETTEDMRSLLGVTLLKLKQLKQEFAPWLDTAETETTETWSLSLA